MEESKYVQSEVKISLQECNSMPARDAMLECLKLNGFKNYKAVDFFPDQDPYWQNDEMTLVLAIEADGRGAMEIAGDLAQFINQVNADEFDYRMVDGEFIMRLWWD